jgi:hypothetical protein
LGLSASTTTVGFLLHRSPLMVSFTALLASALAAVAQEMASAMFCSSAGVFSFQLRMRTWSVALTGLRPQRWSSARF